MQLSKTYDVIHVVWFATTTHNLLATTFQSILGIEICKLITCFTSSLLACLQQEQECDFFLILHPQIFPCA